MKTTSNTFAAVATLTLAFTSAAHSAVFAKYDGIDGESSLTNTRQIESSANQPVPNAPTQGAYQVQATTPGTTMLLLPAVQSAREAARRSSTAPAKKGTVDATWKVEEGVK